MSSTYSISHEELTRIAQLPPEQRGRGVRMTQELGTADDPPPASETAELELELPVVVAVSATHEHAHAHAQGGPRTGGHPGHAVRVAEPGGAHATDTDHGGDDDDDDDDDDDAAVAAAAVLLVVGSAVVLTALAATEGSRFDGWAELPPNQPVHLAGPNGEEGWVPLSKLDPHVAAWADEAVVSGGEGYIRRIERAPLDRVGFTFGLELGAAALGSVEREPAPWGFASRVTFGAFPLQELGLLVGLGVGLGEADDGASLAESRPFFEVQTYPVALGILHLGLYGQVGYAFGDQDLAGGGEQSLDTWYAGGGALAQLDLTTRLALTLRGGAMVLPDPGPTAVAPELTLGLTVY